MPAPTNLVLQRAGKAEPAVTTLSPLRSQHVSSNALLSTVRHKMRRIVSFDHTHNTNHTNKNADWKNPAANATFHSPTSSPQLKGILKKPLPAVVEPPQRKNSRLSLLRLGSRSSQAAGSSSSSSSDMKNASWLLPGGNHHHHNHHYNHHNASSPVPSRSLRRRGSHNGRNSNNSLRSTKSSNHLLLPWKGNNNNNHKTPSLKKAVSFDSDNLHSVRTIQCHHDDSIKNAVWYSKPEIQQIKSHNTDLVVRKLTGQFVEIMDDADDDDDDRNNNNNDQHQPNHDHDHNTGEDTFLGLEPYLRRTAIQTQRQQVRDAVFHEQARQMMCWNEPRSPEKVARAYRRQQRRNQEQEQQQQEQKQKQNTPMHPNHNNPALLAAKARALQQQHHTQAAVPRNSANHSNSLDDLAASMNALSTLSLNNHSSSSSSNPTTTTESNPTTTTTESTSTSTTMSVHHNDNDSSPQQDDPALEKNNDD